MLKAEGRDRNLTDEEAAVYEERLNYEADTDQETKTLAVDSCNKATARGWPQSYYMLVYA